MNVVAAIVPAYNEERTLGGVLSALLATPEVQEVIVVSDGSTDQTAAVARDHGTTVIELASNVGKGGAMRAGIERAGADIVVFVDADLVGLSPDHVRGLLRPVDTGEADMSVGVFDSGRLSTDLAQRIAPFLSGQRALRRDIALRVPGMERSRYGVEVALHRFAEREGLRVAHVHLQNLAQVMKEEKRGVFKGFVSRLRMYWEIVRLSR